jgi:hypothetical protein
MLLECLRGALSGDPIIESRIKAIKARKEFLERLGYKPLSSKR